jgi:hypothetical protein
MLEHPCVGDGRILDELHLFHAQTPSESSSIPRMCPDGRRF